MIELWKFVKNYVELKYCLKVIQEEITLRNYYELQNLALKKFYETKLKDTLAKGKEEYEIMKRKLYGINSILMILYGWFASLDGKQQQQAKEKFKNHFVRLC